MVRTGPTEIRPKRLPHASVGGVDVAIVGEAGLVQAMLDDCTGQRRERRALAVLDSNGQAISLAATNKDFARALDQADLVHADGQFIVWASRFSGRPSVPERTATTDFIHAASQAAANAGLSFYLLGGTEEVNAECARILQERYPGLTVVGRNHGYFADQDADGIVEEINRVKPDILWVGLGKPREQIFAIEQRDRLNCRWVVTCGGCFNFVTGGYRRAPRWMQSAGLEWLHRMATGPAYLIPRYLLTIPHAIFLVIWHSAPWTNGNRTSKAVGDLDA